MDGDPTTPAAKRYRPRKHEIEERRDITIKTFLFSSLTRAGIAHAVSAIMTAAHKDDNPPKVFHFDRHDIRRDLDWWKATNAERYAAGRTLNAGELIGHALDFNDRLQREIMQLYTNASARTGRDRESITKLDRLLRTAWQLERDRINLAYNLGLVSRTTAGDVEKRIGNMLDYERVRELAKAKLARPIVAPGTAKWIGSGSTTPP